MAKITTPHRVMADDGEAVPEARRLTAVQKWNAHLDLLLSQIANFCPVLSRSSIVQNSVSLNDIWQKIRQHYMASNPLGLIFLIYQLVSANQMNDQRTYFNYLITVWHSSKTV